MIITGIDIGLFNLGLVLVDLCDDTFTINKVIACERVNIKSLVTNCGCKEFQHRLCIADYTKHLFRDYSNYFKDSKYILVERQPPAGFLSIQDLITFEYGEKVHLIQPQSVHKFLSFGTIGYEQRKEMSERYVEKYLGSIQTYTREKRRHDMADAMCLILFYVEHLKNKKFEEERREFELENYTSFEQFRYIPN